VLDNITRWKEFGIKPVIVDPQADASEAKDEYGF